MQKWLGALLLAGLPEGIFIRRLRALLLTQMLSNPVRVADGKHAPLISLNMQGIAAHARLREIPPCNKNA
jgi:hypothetical protein